MEHLLLQTIVKQNLLVAVCGTQTVEQSFLGFFAHAICGERILQSDRHKPAGESYCAKTKYLDATFQAKFLNSNC